MTKPRFKRGDRVKLTEDALDNYGEYWHATEFEITAVSTFYCPAAKHFAPGHSKSCAGHPGYDGSAGGGLYDLRQILDCNCPDGEHKPWNNSVYDWEIERT